MTEKLTWTTTDELLNGNLEEEMLPEAVIAETTDEVTPEMDLTKRLHLACQQNFGVKIFQTWLQELYCQTLQAETVVLTVNSEFTRDWIQREYWCDRKIARSLAGEEQIVTLPGLKTLVQQLVPNLRIVQLQVENHNIAEADQTIGEGGSGTGTEDKITNLSRYDNVFTFGSELNEAYRLENFIVSDENRLVFTVLNSIAEDRYQYKSTPIFLYGNTGVGKSHLAQGVIWKIQAEHKQRRVLYLSAEQFMQQFIQAVQIKKTLDFKKRFQVVDLLIIDDLQFFLGKLKTLNEFFYIFNNLVESGKQVVLLADQEPNQMLEMDRKIKSRVAGGIILELTSKTRETKTLYLEAKLRETSLELSPEMQSYLLDNSENIQAVAGSLKKLTLYREVYGRPVTMADLEAIMRNYQGQTLEGVKLGHCEELEVKTIQNKVALHYHVSFQELVSCCRNQKFAFPRQVAMYLTKKYTRLALQDIAEAFGKKNHATVLHAINKISQQLSRDLTLKEELLAIEHSW